MNYVFDLAIPANTTKASPVSELHRLTHGIIHRVEVSFPPGCAGLAHVVILRGLHQLWPTNPEGSFHSDSYTSQWNDYHRLFAEPFAVVLKGWNLDDTYPHTITVRLALLEREVLEPETREVGFMRRLGQVLFGPPGR